MNQNRSNNYNEQIKVWRETAERLAKYGLYDPAHEHDACGVGMVVSIDGKRRREVVEAGVEALKALWHRGAVDADGKTGDGAGIHVEIPQDFFQEHTIRTGHTPNPGPIAVGMIFLPRTDLSGQERCRSIVEAQILQFGYTIYGWRQVPINVEVIGEKANATRPEIEQIMIAGKPDTSDEIFERDLYVIRRRIENQVISENIPEFYIYDSDEILIDTIIKRYNSVIENLRLIKRPKINRWPEQDERWSEIAIGQDVHDNIIVIYCSSILSMFELNEILLLLPIQLQTAQHLEGNSLAQLYLNTGTYEINHDNNLYVPNLIGVKSK